MKNKRETFEHIAAHLLQQGTSSMDDVGMCAYRGAFKRRCAVGCCIADEFYLKEFEGTGIGETSTDTKEPKRQRILKAVEDSGYTADRDMLLRLQTLHDCTPPNLWEDCLNKLREEFFPGETHD